MSRRTRSISIGFRYGLNRSHSGMPYITRPITSAQFTTTILPTTCLTPQQKSTKHTYSSVIHRTTHCLPLGNKSALVNREQTFVSRNINNPKTFDLKRKECDIVPQKQLVNLVHGNWYVISTICGQKCIKMHFVSDSYADWDGIKKCSSNDPRDACAMFSYKSEIDEFFDNIFLHSKCYHREFFDKRDELCILTGGQEIFQITTPHIAKCTFEHNDTDTDKGGISYFVVEASPSDPHAGVSYYSGNQLRYIKKAVTK